MIKKVILTAVIIFTIMTIQFVVLFVLSKERKRYQLYKNIKSFFLASIFIAIMFSLVSELSNHFNYKLILLILMASIIPTYWFVFAPLKYLFNHKKFYRDKDLEREIKSEGFNFKILFTEQLLTNAYATGIIPFYKIIIIGKDLKEKLSNNYLKAIIYHEIGHHEHKHILKLYFINILLQTFFFLVFFKVNIFHFDNSFIKPIIIFLIGAFAGFIFWFIPGKIMRLFEYQADIFSAKKYKKDNIIGALEKLDSISNGKISKGNFNHPNLEKRIKHIEKT